MKKPATAKPPAPPQAAWFVYLLRCADGTLYTGIARDLARRCAQHNAGTASRYTRCRLPARLEYHETHPTRSQALKRESAIKRLSRRQKEALIRTLISCPQQAGSSSNA